MILQKDKSRACQQKYHILNNDELYSIFERVSTLGILKGRWEMKNWEQRKKFRQKDKRERASDLCVHVCVQVCMHIHGGCLCVCTCTCVYKHACVCVHMGVYAGMCTHGRVSICIVCTHMYAHAYRSTRMHVYVCIGMDICMRVGCVYVFGQCTCACLCVCVLVHKISTLCPNQ